jgi:hypothetical protein
MSQGWPDIRAAQHRRVKRGKRAVRGNNATVPKKTEASGGAIHCCVCINRGNFRRDPRGITVIKGYAACPDHIELVSHPGFDVFMLSAAHETRRSV